MLFAKTGNGLDLIYSIVLKATLGRAWFCVLELARFWEGTLHIPGCFKPWPLDSQGFPWRSGLCPTPSLQLEQGVLYPFVLWSVAHNSTWAKGLLTSFRTFENPQFSSNSTLQSKRWRIKNFHKLWYPTTPRPTPASNSTISYCQSWDLYSALVTLGHLLLTALCCLHATKYPSEERLTSFIFIFSFL